MKYSRLSLEDLSDLEKEFIDFLVINGITAGEWTTLKNNDIEKAEKVIDQFSDVVWESILQKSEIVELRRKGNLTLCYVSESELHTLFIKSDNPELDLTLENDIEKILSKIKKSNLSVKKEKLKTPKTNQIFDLLQTGFYLTNNPKYKALF